MKGVTNDGGNAHFGTERGAHPQHIMIAPLDIDGVTLHEEVEDSVGTIAAIEKISDDVQFADRKALDECAKHFNKLGAGVDLNDGIKQFIVVNGLSAVEFGISADQFDDDRLKFLGDFAANLRRGVFIGHEFSQFDQTGNVDAIPLGLIVDSRQYFFHLFARVIDESAELGAILFGEAATENVINFLPNDARTIIDDVEKCGVFAMQIGNKMLGGFGQAQLGFQMNDLFVDRLLRRVLFGKVMQHFRGEFSFLQWDHLPSVNVFQRSKSPDLLKHFNWRR